MPRRTARALALLVTGLVLGVLPSAAWAQVVDPPPATNELGLDDNWTFKMGDALLLGAALMTVALVALFLVKSRGFKANARRGGSK